MSTDPKSLSPDEAYRAARDEAGAQRVREAALLYVRRMGLPDDILDDGAETQEPPDAPAPSSPAGLRLEAGDEFRLTPGGEVFRAKYATAIVVVFEDGDNERTRGEMWVPIRCVIPEPKPKPEIARYDKVCHAINTGCEGIVVGTDNPEHFLVRIGDNVPEAWKRENVVFIARPTWEAVPSEPEKMSAPIPCPKCGGRRWKVVMRDDGLSDYYPCALCGCGHQGVPATSSPEPEK